MKEIVSAVSVPIEVVVDPSGAMVLQLRGVRRPELVVRASDHSVLDAPQAAVVPDERDHTPHIWVLQVASASALELAQSESVSVVRDL